MTPQYHLQRNETELGPYDLAQLQHMERSKELHPDDLLREIGSSQWKKALVTPGLFGRALPMGKKTKIILGAGAGCGLLVFGLTALMVLAAIFSSSSTSPTPGYRAQAPSLTEQIRLYAESGFNDNKQKIFDSVHPVGTAKNVVVHEVTIDAWHNQSTRSRWEDVKQFTIRYTLYWEGPIEKDGFTKITQTYDNESQRFVSGKILATNGTTNSEVGEALLMAGSALLRGE